MDNKYKSFKLKVCLGLVVSGMLLGQTATAADTAKHSSKSTKAKRTHAATTTKSKHAIVPVAKPAPAVAAVKPTAVAAPKPEPLVALGPEARELVTPKSTIEAGVGGVSEGSWKFGQYNGLENRGAYGIGNFDINGGGAYDSDDATRWRLTGKNIGLETREFAGEYKNQGKYKLNFGYDVIQRFSQGSYQTPYIGSGGNELLLNPNWGYPATANNMRTLPAKDAALMNQVDLSTKRRRIDGGFSYFLDPQWELKASMRHEERNGTQPLGAPIVAARGVTLANPISQATDQINASMNFTGDKAYGSFAYYGSIFHNDYNSVIFQNPFSAPSASNAKFGQMSTAPDNQFHQFTASGGYNFSADTKLVAGGSYGRNWQDQGFLPYSTMTMLYPTQSNLNGAVDFKSVNAKLTHKVDKDLNLAASYKYDERENLSSVSTYQFPDVDTTGLGSNFRNNTPFSRRVQTGNLDANYAIAKGHNLKAGYELQNIDRWCNGTWTNCADTSTTREHIGRLDYRGNLFDKLNAKLGYAYSHRDADNYNQDSAYLASFQQPQTLQDVALYNRYMATGLPSWGPALGYPSAGVAYPYPSVFANNNAVSLLTGSGNAADINGLGRFNTAARNRQSFNSLLDYQLTDHWNVGVNGDYRYDDYNQSSYGLQSARNWSLNFDTSYAFSEDFSAHLFYTYQDIKSKTAGMSYGSNAIASSGTAYSSKAGSVVGGCYNTLLAMNSNAKVDPCRNWLSDMSDNIDTVGFSLKHKGLLSGKLELNGDFLYSFARTMIDVNGGSYATVTGASATNGPSYYIPAADMPQVKTQTFQVKLGGKYNINKSSAAHLTYLYQHMISNDYVYTGMNPLGTPTGVLPTNEKAPLYSVHVVGLSYVYSF